jgi:hypothetical protein
MIQKKAVLYFKELEKKHFNPFTNTPKQSQTTVQNEKKKVSALDLEFYSIMQSVNTPEKIAASMEKARLQMQRNVFNIATELHKINESDS